MHKYLIGILLLASFNVNAQTAYLDSLKKAISLIDNDSLRVRIHFKIAWNSFYMDEEQALAHIDSAQAIAADNNFGREVIVSNHYYGLYYRGRSDYNKAIQYFKKALEGFKAMGDKRGMTAPLYNLGAVYNDLGDLEHSVDYYLQEMKLNEELELYSSVANSCNGIGILYKQMGDHNQALNFYNKGLSILRDYPDKEIEALLDGNKANIFIEQTKWDSALFYAQRAFDIETELQRSWGLAYANNSMAQIYLGMNRPIQAMTYVQQAIQTNKDLSSKKELVENQFLLGRILLSLSQEKEAELSALEGLELANEIRLQQGQQEGHELLSNIYQQIGQPAKAIEHLKMYYELKDSLISEKHVRTVNNLNLKYESEKNQQQITEQATTIEKQKSRQKWFTGITILLSLFTLLLYLLYSSRKKLQQQREINQKKEIENLKNENRILSMDAMITGQEEERKRIARELHDGLGGLLFTARLKMQKIQADIDDLPGLKLYDQAEEMIVAASEEVRRISHAMMPESLINQGLVVTLEDLVSDLRQSTSLNINFYTAGIVERLPIKIASNVYRIIQELTSNAVKHADASMIFIQVVRANDTLQITIEDDGKGIEIENPKEGIGLENVRSRVAFMAGQIEIISSKIMGGTSIEILIPIIHSN